MAGIVGAGVFWGCVRKLAVVTLSVVASAQGCRVPKVTVRRAPDVPAAPGVTVRHAQVGLSAVRVIDVDLGSGNTRVEVVAQEIRLRDGLVTGRARTLPDWLSATGAVAGVNGGFFGKTAGTEYKEIVGLLKQDGRVRAAAPLYRSRQSGERYSRSALGFTRLGTPRMAWVSSRPGKPSMLLSHPGPEVTEDAPSWTVQQAVACGPRLVRDGRVNITYRGERLASPGMLPRTFVGFGGGREKRHLVLCAADGMEFSGCAQFLMEYFRREHGVPCSEGMCMDGGASTQAAWREGGAIHTDPDPGTTVPTALLVFAK